jgi:hypothetical protein
MKEESEEMMHQYRERLKKIISKKLETTMIFPLSQFEAAFGHLWGNGLEEDELTKDQKMMREKWKECRTNILNCGNTQIRNSNSELNLHDVVWRRYESVLVPVNKTEYVD